MSTFHCESCKLSKHHRVSSHSRVPSPFELVHFFVLGPLNVASNKFHYGKSEILRITHINFVEKK
jgi:hypothetical protein